MLKHFCSAAGLDPTDYSSHSLRRGGCTFLSLCGTTLEELRVRGDWASDTNFAYLQTPLNVRIIDDIRVSNALSADHEDLVWDCDWGTFGVSWQLSIFLPENISTSQPHHSSLFCLLGPTVYIYIYTYSKTTLNGPTLEPTFNGPFREVISFGSYVIVTLVLYGRSFGTQIKR